MAAKFRKEVLNLPAYHLDQPKHKVKLNQNESPYDLPAPLKRKILARLGRLDWNRYPSPYADGLRSKIARRVGWKASGVLLANGSNVLTQALVASTAVKGKVLISDPTFSLYGLYGALFANRVYRVPAAKDFSLDRKAIIRALRRSRPDIIFIANPNAPTGTPTPTADLEAIVRAARCLVVVDEAYYPFSGATLLRRLRRYPNLILLRTLSKAFSLGGARVGYLLGDPKVIAQVQKVVPPFCLNALSEAVAETVIESPRYVDRIVKEIIAEREKVYEALTELPGITPYPSAANFILFRAKQPQSIFKGLLKKGILIRDVSDRGRLKNCLRVTIGTPAENKKFLNAMKKIARR